MTKVYQVSYTTCVMASSGDEAVSIAHDLSYGGAEYEIKEVQVTDEAVLWLMKLDEILCGTYDNYEAKQADFRAKYVRKFGSNPTDSEWDSLMILVELYGELELYKARRINAED